MVKRLFDPEMFDPALFDTSEPSSEPPTTEADATQGVWATTNPLPKEIFERLADYLEVKVTRKVDTDRIKS
jgi:hypothetical protein